MAHRIRQLHQEQGVELAQIRISFRNLDTYAELVAEVLPRHGLPFYLARGRPLATAPAMNTVFALIDTVLERYSPRRALSPTQLTLSAIALFILRPNLHACRRRLRCVDPQRSVIDRTRHMALSHRRQLRLLRERIRPRRRTVLRRHRRFSHSARGPNAPNWRISSPCEPA